MGGLQSQHHQLHPSHMPRGAWLPCHALHHLKAISLLEQGRECSMCGHHFAHRELVGPADDRDIMRADVIELASKGSARLPIVFY